MTEKMFSLEQLAVDIEGLFQMFRTSLFASMDLSTVLDIQGRVREGKKALLA